MGYYLQTMSGEHVCERILEQQGGHTVNNMHGKDRNQQTPSSAKTIMVIGYSGFHALVYRLNEDLQGYENGAGRSGLLG